MFIHNVVKSGYHVCFLEGVTKGQRVWLSLNLLEKLCWTSGVASKCKERLIFKVNIPFKAAVVFIVCHLYPFVPFLCQSILSLPVLAWYQVPGLFFHSGVVFSDRGQACRGDELKRCLPAAQKMLIKCSYFPIKMGFLH